MAIDWLTEIKGHLKGLRQKMQSLAVDSAYSTIIASTLLPIFSAVHSGDWSALTQLTGTLGDNVAANLIANTIQKWKDKEDAVKQISFMPKDDPIRKHLDTLIEKLDVLSLAKNELSEEDRQWFVKTLRDELTQLGNWTRFESQITGNRNVNIQGPSSGNTVITGDNVNFKTYNIHFAVFNSPPPPGQVNPKILLVNYLNQVVGETAMIDLAGVDRNAVGKEKAARLSLAAVFTSLDTVRGKQEKDPLYLKSKTNYDTDAVTKEVQRESAIAFISQSKYAALLGDPGSGKTTLVNFLTLCLVKEMLGDQSINLERLGKDWTIGPQLPIRVVLRNFAAEKRLNNSNCPGDDLWLHIIGRLGQGLAGFEPYLRQHLLTEGGVLLLDGLDEVPEVDQQREKIKNAVLDFKRQFPNCRIILTSRTYAYQKQEWRLPDFEESVLAPFSDEQIDNFVDRWYAYLATLRPNQPSADAQGRAVLLKQAIKSNPYLHELGQRPLLLTLMASLHAWRGGTLPEQREQLYEESVELLLDIWDLPKTVYDKEGQIVLQTESSAEWFKTSHVKIRQALEELAFKAHSAQPNLIGVAEIKQGDLVSALLSVSSPDIKPARVIEFITDRAGLLLNRGKGLYSFPHRTLQEYMAARYLTTKSYPGLLVKLVQSDVERWREVVLLAGAKVGRGTPFAAWALVSKLTSISCYDLKGCQATDANWQLAMLAGQILLETGIGLSEQLDEDDKLHLKNTIISLSNLVAQGKLPPVDRAKAGIVLGKLGDLRPGVGLRSDGLPDITWVEIPKGPFIMGSKKGEAPYGDETPQFTCNLIQKPYWISRYPITVAQYQAFVEAKGYENEQWWTKSGWEWVKKNNISKPKDYDSVFQTPNHPRVGVNYFEAVAYCNWLSNRLTSNIRLPSEAEWERAARGTDGRKYPWGNEEDLKERCNYSETGIGHTSAVGMFPKGDVKCGENEHISDMPGNVLEWCLTEWRENYDKYEKNVNDNPEGDSARVLRGASWSNFDPVDLRCAYRINSVPDDRSSIVGFRCVRVSESAR